jgi:tRNA 2-thiouridine synthesizing protein C
MSEAADRPRKKFLYVNRKAPYGTIYALESLEVVLIGAAFEQQVTLAFLDDGVFQVAKGQNTQGIGAKNFSPAYRALGDYDVRTLLVEKESLEERGLAAGDLLPITHEDDEGEEHASIRIVPRAEMGRIFTEQDVILSF